MTEALNFKTYNSLGLIPGPNEKLEEFQKRVEYCLFLKKIIKQEIYPKDFQQTTQERERELLDEAFCIARIYDIAPSWVPLFFSNHQLRPWQGAATWIFQCEDDASPGALIQMRKAFYNNLSYLRIYKRDDLLAHELCHVARMNFNEPKYEELLAYRISNRSMTKHLGAIVQSAKESYLFLILLIAILAMDLIFLYNGAIQAYLGAMWLKFLPIGLIFWGIWRLKRRQKTLELTLNKLKQLTDQGEAVLFRLTDEEIERFAENEIDDIQNYIKQEPTVRWQLLRSSYGLNRLNSSSETGSVANF